MPSKSLYEPEVSLAITTDYIQSVSTIKEKGKMVYRDLLTLIQEQKQFDIKNIKNIENTLGEYNKRLRILIREMSEFIPEYSFSLETISKAYILGIDSLITSYSANLQSILNEKNKIQTQLCDQELLKTEIRKLKAELIQNNKKSLEETEYLKALIDKYKFTMKLYKKELDYKEDLTYEQS